MAKQAILPAAGTKRLAVRAGLEAFYYTGAHWAVRPFLAGSGAILTFHRVRPPRTNAFQPNSRLEIAPSFLKEIILQIRRSKIDIVSLDEALRRLQLGVGPRFVAMTFDDGYRDNLEFAWPILKQHEVPFVVFVCSAFADGEGELWWITLENIIAKYTRVAITLEGECREFDCSTVENKYATYSAIYSALWNVEHESELRRSVRDLADRHNTDMKQECRNACMNWDELTKLAADPLGTIGAHTVNHLILRKATPQNAYSAMADGAKRIEETLKRPVTHFAYPFGGRSAAGPREYNIAKELGFATAVTTRRGVLFPEHAEHLTALPRLPINGNMQRRRYIDVFLSGGPTAIANRFRHLDVE